LAIKKIYGGKKLFIEELPKNWAVNVDFVPLMNLQVALDSDRELFCGEITVSKQILPSTADEKRIGDLTIKRGDSHREKNRISFGYDDPTQYMVTQKSICQQIQDATGEEQVTIKARGMIHEIPKVLENDARFQGVDHFYHLQYSKGNYYGMWRDRLDVRLKNVAKDVKNELVAHGIIKTPQDADIRSTLRTGYIIDDLHIGRQGWRPLDPNAQPDLLLTLLRNLRRPFWSRDTAIPKGFQIPINHVAARGIAYELDTRGHTILI